MSTTFGPKKFGCCLGCGKEVYHVLAYYTSGPFDGHPSRLGPMLTEETIEDPSRQAPGVQVGFLLSNGSEADVAFCVPCAEHLSPGDYHAVWLACVARGILSFTIDQRPRQHMLVAMLPKLQVWPVAVRYWRREAAEINQLVLARKGSAHASQSPAD